MEHDSDALWREGTDPLALLDDLYPQRTPGSVQPQDRKCRLYLIACARRQWHRLPGVCRGLVDLAEHYAERPRERERLRVALALVAEQLLHSEGAEHDLAEAAKDLSQMAAADPVVSAVLGRLPRRPGGPAGGAGWRGLAALVYLPLVALTPPFAWVPRELHSVELLREVYYNPHAFVPFQASWRTSDVLALARHVYDANDFGQMPVLADALQDAGCDRAEILNHCRYAPAESHARGCWVLDRVLNRG